MHERKRRGTISILYLNCVKRRRVEVWIDNEWGGVAAFTVGIGSGSGSGRRYGYVDGYRYGYKRERREGCGCC